eukprot:scaffold444197_cov19-Prasinocladus_malaysianus.AAC.1
MTEKRRRKEGKKTHTHTLTHLEGFTNTRNHSTPRINRPIRPAMVEQRILPVLGMGIAYILA